MVRAIILAIFSMLFQECVSAAPMPLLDIKRMSEDAELIVVAETLKIDRAGKVSHEFTPGRMLDLDRYFATIRIIRTVKGDALPANELKIEYLGMENVPFPYARLYKGTISMIYLSKSSKADGNYKFTHNYHSVQPASGAALDVGNMNDPLIKIEAEFIHAVKTAKEATALVALDRLYCIRSEQLLERSEEILKTLSGNTRIAFELTVLALRCRKQDVESLKIVLTHPAFQKEKESWTKCEHNLLMSISEICDPKALPILHEMMSHPNVELRKDASFSLNTMADKSSIPVLIIALRDINNEISYNSIVALTRLTKRPGPNYEDYIKDKAKYITEWEKWWKEEKVRMSAQEDKTAEKKPASDATPPAPPEKPAEAPKKD